MCIFKTKSLVLLLVTLLLALFSSGKTQTLPKELSSAEETDSLKIGAAGAGLTDNDWRYQ